MGPDRRSRLRAKGRFGPQARTLIEGHYISGQEKVAAYSTIALLTPHAWQRTQGDHCNPHEGPKTMDLSDLTAEQFKELVAGLVDDRLRALLGEPDLGLALGEAARARLKQSLASAARLSGEDVAEQLGLRW
jgi:hypothetical protein